MTDRRASGDGYQGRVRKRSPSPDLPPRQSTGSTISTSSNPRRRPSRAKHTSNESPEYPTPQWVAHDKSESSKTKGSRVAARRTSRGASPTGNDSPKASFRTSETSEKETDAVGHLPKLSRILERKDSKTPRHRKSSTASPADETTKPSRHHPQHPEDVSVNRRPVRQKHGTLQLRADSLTELPNPSLVSVLSGLTQQTSSSSGSNTTITQKTYDNSHMMKRRPTKSRTRTQAERAPASSNSMDSGSPAVFNYISESMASEDFSNNTLPTDQGHTSPTSSASYSSRDTEPGDDSSSDEEAPQVESPLTSPASARAPEYEVSHYDEQSGSESGSSTSDCTPGHPQTTQGGHHVTIDEGSDDEGEEHGTTNSEGEDDGSEDHEGHHGLPHHMALERVAPPRMPSASSSRHSDPHTRRLRDQEQDLRDHVFQSPQPQRDYNFVDEQSPYPQSQPPASMYDSYPPTGASPTNPYAVAHHVGGWPPPMPPPLPIGYYSPTQVPLNPYSPGAESRFAMAPFSPQAQAPSGMVHMPPDLAHAQPPHYQPYPSGPDSTKATVVGYELLADKLTEVSKQDNDGSTEGQVVPMYRKFEKLNHRILLHLQDEITELEEELRFIDESIAQTSPRGDAGQISPASRRGDARYGGELHFKRTELLGRIYIKLGQYNQALSSYSSMLKNLDPASVEDTQTYRNWLEMHAPIERTEARFLEHKSDLLAMPISRRKSANTVGGVGIHQSFAIALPLILMLPLTSFAMIPGLLGRLFIIILIGSMEIYLVVTTELLQLMAVKEWALCASLYFGLMAFLASVVQ